MYNDDEEKRSLPIKSFLMCLILIIIFVLLLVWLLPMPNLTGLNNKIFNANIQEMKNAAIPYFTTDKLPKQEGDSVKLTLQEMIDLKLLLPFTDKNGEACDTQNSYILLTKKKEGEGYELKTFLKCKDEENYIITTFRGGSKELVSEDRYGKIIPNNKVENVEKALITAILNPKDCKEAAEACCRRVSTNFTWKQTADAVERLMRDE